jgi:hypothetical protein
MIAEWTDEEREAFGRDGFLIVEEGFLDDDAVEALRERFEPLFAGDSETGIRPDEVNWVSGRDPEDRHAPDLQRVEGDHRGPGQSAPGAWPPS